MSKVSDTIEETKEVEEIKNLQNEIEEIKTNLLNEKTKESNIITPLNIEKMTDIKENRMLIFGGTGILGTGLIKKFYDRYRIFVYSRNFEKHQNLPKF